MSISTSILSVSQVAVGDGGVAGEFLEPAVVLAARLGADEFDLVFSPVSAYLTSAAAAAADRRRARGRTGYEPWCWSSGFQDGKEPPLT